MTVLDQQTSAPLVFLCYAREDFARVYSLYILLKNLGLQPWMDKCDIIAGKEWRPQIEDAVQKADFFIASFSKASVKKQGYVQREYKYALDTLVERPAGSIFLIPVRLDDCEIPPLRNVGIKLPDIQWVDLFQTDPFTESDIEPILKAFEIQSNWRRPNTELMAIVKKHEQNLDPSIMETLKVRELPYTDKIIEFKAQANRPEQLKQEEKAFKLYLSTAHPHDYQLGLENYYFIASYLYRAIINNNFAVCKQKPFIYPIHQYLSKMIRSSSQIVRESILSTLTNWLVSKENVYETSRDFAAFELGMSKANDAIEALLEALDDSNELPLVRYYAAMSLGMIGNTKPLNNLIEIYRRERDKKLQGIIAHTIIHIWKNQA